MRTIAYRDARVKFGVGGWRVARGGPSEKERETEGER